MKKATVFLFIFGGLSLALIASFFGMQFLLWIGMLFMIIGSFNIEQLNQTNVNQRTTQMERVHDVEVIEKTSNKYLNNKN